MPGASFILDTNAAIAWLNRSPEIAAVFDTTHQPALPLIVLGELEFGARNSVRAQQNQLALEGLLRESLLLLPDRQTAGFYGEILLQQRRKGRPIPTNDIWIAAQSRQHNLPLLTRDLYFDEVEDLELIRW